MGRSGTWLVAAAVCVLGLAALVDAFVGGDSTESGGSRAPRPQPPAPSGLVAVGADFLRDESVVGRLLVADPRCRVRTLDLPSLAEGIPTGLPTCGFTTSPDGVVGTDRHVLSPDEPYAAVCNGDVVEVLRVVGGDSERGPELGARVARARGCAPAWSEEGRLTVVRKGEAVDLGRPEIPGQDVVILSRADLEPFAEGALGFTRPEVREIAWMRDGVLAAVIRDGGGEGDILALFRDGELFATTPSPYERLSGLRVSPRGTFAATQIGDAPALVVLDDEGEFVPIGLRGYAVTWSPDEVFTAVAADDGIYVYETASRASRFARIPLEVRDLFWL